MQEEINKVFPPEISEVYVVHAGTFKDPKTGEQGIARQVCTRFTMEEAQGIADMLNEAQEGVMYLKYVAQGGFQDCRGGREDLERRAEHEDMRVGWERLIAPHRKPIYTVAHLKLQNEEDVKELNKVIQEEINPK